MRMYSPEWEAILDFEFTPRMVEVQFDLEGQEIPADHGYALYEEILRYLPWLGDTPQAGVHPVHGAPSGRNENLVLNRRAKLVLRLPVERLEDARALVGAEIDPGAGPIRVGALKPRRMIPFQTLYSHIVVMGPEDEVEFLARVRAELEAMDIRCGLICGRKRHMTTPEGVLRGYSLMLHDVTPLQSLKIQEEGLGLHRGYGCGIFIPHKSIKEVVAP